MTRRTEIFAISQLVFESYCKHVWPLGPFILKSLFKIILSNISVFLLKSRDIGLSFYAYLSYLSKLGIKLTQLLICKVINALKYFKERCANPASNLGTLS